MGRAERKGTVGEAFGREAVVNVVGGEETHTRVTVLEVVPVEEILAVGSAVLDATEPRWKVRPVLECLEMGLGEWVVV